MAGQRCLQSLPLDPSRKHDHLDYRARAERGTRRSEGRVYGLPQRRGETHAGMASPVRSCEPMKLAAGRAGGFTYAAILIAVALVGVSLAMTGEVWRTTVQREKELELLFVGDEIRRAITQYYESTPGTAKRFPASLEDLLKDERYPTTRRYLRKIYRDPMTGTREWGLMKGPGGTVMGVYSLSKQAPIKRANFPPDYAAFMGAADYRDWQFAYGATSGAQQTSAVAPVVAPPSGSPIPTSAVIGTMNNAPSAQPTTKEPEKPKLEECQEIRATDVRTCEGLKGKGLAFPACMT